MNTAKHKPGIWETFWHRKSDGYGMREHFPGTHAALEQFYSLLPKAITDPSDLQVARAMMNGTEAMVKIADTFIDAETNGVPKTAFKKAYETYVEEKYGKAAAEAVKAAVDAKGTLAGQLKERLGQAAGATLSILVHELGQHMEERASLKDAEWHRANGRAVHPESHLANSGHAHPENIGFREGSCFYYSDELEYVAKLRREHILASNPVQNDPFLMPSQIKGTYLEERIAGIGRSQEIMEQFPVQEEMELPAPAKAEPSEPGPDI